MKNLIKIATIAFGVGFSGIANAQSIASVETPTYLAVYNVSPETNRIRVYVKKQEDNQTPLFMRLFDDKGIEIYNKKFGKNENQGIVLLSLREVPDGNYTLEMSDKNGTKTQVFKKGHEEIAVKRSSILVAVNDEPRKNQSPANLSPKKKDTISN